MSGGSKSRRWIWWIGPGHPGSTSTTKRGLLGRLLRTTIMLAFLEKEEKYIIYDNVGIFGKRREIYIYT